MNALKHDAMADRRHLLENNLEPVMELLVRATCPDPVALIADERDHHGRQLAIHSERTYKGLSAEEATKKVDEFVAQYQGKGIPTLNAIVPLSEAEKILPRTSPTAKGNLRRWKQLRRHGDHLVVVVAAGGNTYATVEFPAVARDGQNRLPGRMSEKEET
jgi:hypothetical protein